MIQVKEALQAFEAKLKNLVIVNLGAGNVTIPVEWFKADVNVRLPVITLQWINREKLKGARNQDKIYSNISETERKLRLHPLRHKEFVQVDIYSRYRADVLLILEKVLQLLGDTGALDSDSDSTQYGLDKYRIVDSSEQGRKEHRVICIYWIWDETRFVKEETVRIPTEKEINFK